MKPVRIVQGRAVPLPRSDVDTDQIIPSDWLKRVERTGFEKGLFSEWRDDPSFVMNDERYAGANILIAGSNFGVGSSREHAVWALQQAGFQAVVSARFGDIFRNNSVKCGLLPVEVSPELATRLLELTSENADLELTIDLGRKNHRNPRSRHHRALQHRRNLSPPPNRRPRRHRPDPPLRTPNHHPRNHPPRLAPLACVASRLGGFTSDSASPSAKPDVIADAVGRRARMGFWNAALQS